MALLTSTDIQDHLNIDLTSPNGQAAATELIAAAIAWVEGQVGYPLESSSQTAWFEDGEQHFFLPTKAPVASLAVSSFNSATASYDTVDPAYIRFSTSGEVDVQYGLPSGFQAVKAVYTAGWTAATLPRDLRDALIELVGLKLQQVANYSAVTSASVGGVDTTTTPAGGLKRVQADTFTAEYSTAQFDAIWKAKGEQLAQTIGDDVPSGILNTVRRYRRAFAV